MTYGDEEHPQDIVRQFKRENAKVRDAVRELRAACKGAEAWVVVCCGGNPAITHPKALQNAKDDLARLRAALTKTEGLA
jgi:hypothetical protein